jgi:hypothetical protein
LTAVNEEELLFRVEVAFWPCVVGLPVIGLFPWRDAFFPAGVALPALVLAFASPLSSSPGNEDPTIASSSDDSDDVEVTEFERLNRTADITPFDAEPS